MNNNMFQWIQQMLKRQNGTRHERNL